MPEFQHFTVGDEVPISPVASMAFYAIEKNRYLIWSGYDGGGGFTWALYPVDERYTRLVSRIRWSHNWRKPSQLALDLITEFTDHLSVRKILQGVKGRVEGRIEPMARANTEFAVYLGAACIFLGAIVLILLRPLTWRGWLAGSAAGASWLITWYAPIPTRIGALLALLVLWGLGGGHIPLLSCLRSTRDHPRWALYHALELFPFCVRHAVGLGSLTTPPPYVGSKDGFHRRPSRLAKGLEAYKLPRFARRGCMIFLRMLYIRG